MPTENSRPSQNLDAVSPLARHAVTLFAHVARSAMRHRLRLDGYTRKTGSVQRILGFRLISEKISTEETPGFARALMRVSYKPEERFGELLHACRRVGDAHKHGRLEPHHAVSAIARLFEFVAMSTKTPCHEIEQETRAVGVLGLDAPPTIWEGHEERRWVFSPLRSGRQLPVLAEVRVRGGDVRETEAFLRGCGYGNGEHPSLPDVVLSDV